MNKLWINKDGYTCAAPVSTELSAEFSHWAEPRVINNVAAQPAVLQATIHVTRKATGKVETYQIVGTPAEVKGEAGRIPKKEAP